MNYFDLHCDTLYEATVRPCSLLRNDLQLSVERGNELDLWVQCFALWVPDDCRGYAAISLFQRAYQTLQRNIQLSKGALVQCRTYDQVQTVKEEKHVCHAVLTVEGGAVLGGKLDTLDLLQKCGVKALTLTWNGSCEMGDGQEVKQAKGLTPFGKRALEKMEQLEIVADVSHASDALFYDVASRSAKPFIATHSNARAVCPHKRNLTDEQFLTICHSGGVVGLNFYPPFLEASGKANLSSLRKHLEHFLELGGEDHLCIGSDFDGAQMFQGMEGVESIPFLYEQLLQAHYEESLLHKLFFENAWRFFSTL